MEVFATASDLESRWRKMDPAEQARATELLKDASAIILAALKQAHINVDKQDEVQAANLVRVSCAMVQRAMAQGDGEQQHAWGGNLAANPSGDLYLSRADRRSLGIGGARIGVLSLL